MSKKGLITQLNSKIKDIELDKKAEFGKLVNELKTKFNTFYDEKNEYYLQEILNTKLEKEKVDITLSNYNIPTGAPSILEKTSGLI